MRLCAGALLSLVLCQAMSQAQSGAASDAVIDPIGMWRCVLYGNPEFGDERILLRFLPDQSTRMARLSQAGTPSWLPLSDWQSAEDELSFTDTRTGRRFSAALSRTTLSGEWRTLNQLGGWWCSAADAADGSGIDILDEERGTERQATRRLIPEVMATPTFPRQAVRDAREGRVVLCFVVEPDGEIYEPEFVELSHEIFRASSLDALMRSRYKSWDPRHEGGARPACRSFIYKLDYIYQD